MKKAILLFHGSQLGDGLHPFLISEIEHFYDCFDQVYVFSLKPKCSISEINKYKNVQMITIGLLSLYLRLWLIIPSLFTKYFWKDVLIAVNNHIFSIQYLKKLAMQVIYGSYFSQKANKLIKQSPDDCWVIDAYWLTGPAYAAARIKRKHPEIISFSRLHSFEADVCRNPHAICQMKGYIDRYLDYIFFVSAKGKQQYISIINKYYSSQLIEEKYIVNRLGVKDYHGVNEPSLDGTFRILSCSRLVSLKRVSLLAEVFSDWSGKKIEWIHIGDGEERDNVEKYIKTPNKASNSQCVLMGNLEHDQVIEYYKNHPVDLFINISIYEGLPVSIMEALSFGVPVIATNAGATEELVNNSNGLLIDKDITKEDVVDAVQSIISMSKEDYLQLRENAYSTYLDYLDTNENFDQLLKTINVYNLVIV